MAPEERSERSGGGAGLEGTGRRGMTERGGRSSAGGADAGSAGGSTAPGFVGPQHREAPGHSPEGPDGRLPVALVTAIDPVLRGGLVASLLLDAAGAVELRYEVDAESAALRRLVVDAAQVLEDERVELDHPCVSCAMREDVVPTLDRLSRDPRVGAVLLTPPLSAEPDVVAGTLAPHQRRWHLTGAAAVLDAGSARHDLLDADMLEERGIAWGQGDRRSVGEALAAQIEYSPLIVVDAPPSEEAEAGIELVEHLRAADQLLVTDPYALDPVLLLGGVLDHGAGLRRRDPRHVESHGGPTAHGTWTLDLSSERPFHPERFLEHIEELGGGALRGRGRFWVPDRPGTIARWDGAGGQVSVGSHAESGRALPTTRLVVTGVGAADAERVRAAFVRCLLTPEEWAQGLAPWMGREDLLAPWLGERGARV